MVINNGSLTLAEPLMYTPNSGNFNNSTGKAKKILNCFSGHFFEKQMRQSRSLFLFSRNFFSKLRTIFVKSCACKAISSDIIQVRP